MPGAAQRQPGALASLFPAKFLQKVVAAEVPVLGALAAAGILLARVLRHEGIELFFARDVFRGRCHMVEDGNQIQIRLSRPLVVVRQDVKSLIQPFDFWKSMVLRYWPAR